LTQKKIAIFVPGYYGSTLIDRKSGRLIWGDAKEIFIGRKSLALPIPGMKTPGALDLEAYQLIPDMKVFGGLLKEEAYDKTIALLKSIGTEEVFSVAWDWRREPHFGILRIDKTVKQAKEKYPKAEIILVSHSFGSLISSYYIRYGTLDYHEAKVKGENWEGLNHFSHVVLSATPFRGLMEMFHNMHYGIKFGLNHNMQTALAFSSFESSYFLLPSPDKAMILDENNQSHLLDIYDPKKWIENKWGLFSEDLKLASDTIDARKNFLIKNLESAKIFHKLIDAPFINPPANKKKLMYLSGYGHKTIHTGVWHKHKNKNNIFLFYPKNFKKWKSKMKPDCVYGDGDLTIPDFSLKLPSSMDYLKTQHVHEKLGHLNTLQHPSSQEKIKEFLSK